jgi:hypothetical protein
VIRYKTVRSAATAVALMVAVLLCSAPALSQPGTARVSGRVVDREQGAPIPQAVVRVTSAESGDSRADTTDASGRYAIPLPGGRGPFVLRAARLGYRPLTVSIAPEEAAGGVVIRDLSLGSADVQLAPLTVEQSAPQRERMMRRGPGGSDAITHSWSGGTVPIDPGDLNGLSTLELGVQQGDGGVSFFAQDPSQTRTTLDGAAFGSSTVPQEALASVAVAGNTYDVARGQFSGGMIAARTLAGTNKPGGALRARYRPSVPQWWPGASSPGFFLTALDAGAGGALVRDRLFWYAAANASATGSDGLSLESSTPAALQRLGVHADSAMRLRALLQEHGLSAAGASPRPGSRAAAGLLRLDYDMAAAHSLMVRLDARHLELRGLGLNALSTAATAGTVREGGHGVLAQLDSRGRGVENELRLNWAGQWRDLDPERRGPAGTLRISSPGGPDAGSAVLRFGGSPLEGEFHGTRVEMANHATVGAGPEHRLQGGMVYAVERASAATTSNAYGTFFFNSLEDVRANRPALFTRTLGESGVAARSRYAAAYLGDTWTRGRLRVSFGARLEEQGYASDAVSGAVAGPSGTRPGRIPSSRGVSPRLGWSYAGKGWYLLGGAGEFRGMLPLAETAVALGETGVADRQHLSCVGQAAPAPEWSRYADEPGAAPVECAAGAPVFASRTSPLTVFTHDFAPPRTWRTSLGGQVPLLDRFRFNFETSLTRGVSQPLAMDRNLGAPLLVLAKESGRPVYAPASAIDPATGGVAADVARPYPALGSVREISARGTATVLQATGGFVFPYPTMGRFSVSAGYTYTRAADRVGPLPALGFGGPLAPVAGAPARGTSDRERRHDLRLRLMYRPWPSATIGVLGRLTSGAPFTPRVDGDVNGDGARNDAAFVFDPASGDDPVLAAGMARLLAEAPRAVRECLRRQVGRIAGRNSCRGPWVAGLDLRTDLFIGLSGAPRSFQLSASTSNLLGAVDRLVNGRAGAHGWGEAAPVDPLLLRVRGFDPGGPAFLYEANPGFGARTGDARWPGRSFSVTIEGRLSVGADPAYQPLQRLINQTVAPGRSREELRAELAVRIPNPALQVIALDSALRLSLDAGQRARLQERAQGFGWQAGPLADSIATAQSDVENGRRLDTPAAWREINALAGRVRQAIREELLAIRQILTPGQWDRLPAAVREPSQPIVPPRGIVPAPRGS